jgi:hypothetical protein
MAGQPQVIVDYTDQVLVESHKSRSELSTIRDQPLPLNRG